MITVTHSRLPCALTADAPAAFEDLCDTQALLAADPEGNEFGVFTPE
jgi:hypothetical protein